MIFHVINRETGEPIAAQGFWAIDEDGALIDVMDGWGCEGGGGSASAPTNAIAVMGAAPVPAVVTASYYSPKPFKCAACGKNFATELGKNQHFDKVHM